MLPLGFQLRSSHFWDHRGPRNDALITVVDNAAIRKVLLLLQKSDFLIQDFVHVLINACYFTLTDMGVYNIVSFGLFLRNAVCFCMGSVVWPTIA